MATQTLVFQFEFENEKDIEKFMIDVVTLGYRWKNGTLVKANSD
jgi:hypothetical protein